MKRRKPATILAPQIPGAIPLLTECGVRDTDEYEYSDVRVVNAEFTGLEAGSLQLLRVFIRTSTFSATHFVAPRATDVRFEDCDFASAHWERLALRRVEIVRCRLTGFSSPEAYLRNVRIQNCTAKLTNFRFASFQSIQFVDCDLEEADFQGADLSGVAFVRCDLSHAQLSHTKLNGTDFRTSEIEGMRVGAAELPGAIVDHFQAAYLAGLLGLDIRDSDDD